MQCVLEFICMATCNHSSWTSEVIWYINKWFSVKMVQKRLTKIMVKVETFLTFFFYLPTCPRQLSFFWHLESTAWLPNGEGQMKISLFQV